MIKKCVSLVQQCLVFRVQCSSSCLSCKLNPLICPRAFNLRPDRAESAGRCPVIHQICWDSLLFTKKVKNVTMYNLNCCLFLSAAYKTFQSTCCVWCLIVSLSVFWDAVSWSSPFWTFNCGSWNAGKTQFERTWHKMLHVCLRVYLWVCV